MYIFIVAGILLLTALLWSRRPEGKKIPGPRGWPVVGMLFEANPKSLHLTVDRYAREYGEIVAFDILGRRVVFLNSERMIRKAFAEGPAKFMLNDRPETYVGKHCFNGQSIIFHQRGFNSEHDLLRKGFHKGFRVYGDGVKAFEKNVQSEIMNLIERIDGYKGAEFEVMAVVKHSIINLMSIFLRGHDVTREEEESVWEYNRMTDLIATPMVDFMLLKLPFLTNALGIFKTTRQQHGTCLEKLMKQFLDKQRMTFDETETRGFVDFLLHNEVKNGSDDVEKMFTDEQIRGVISDVLLGGVTSTVSSLSSLILCLAHHPEVQKKAQQEIQNVIGNDRLPTLDDKAMCPYIEAVFMEIQRYLTVATFGVLHNNRDGMEFEGYNLPKNATVAANLWFLHHDERIWGDPWTFRPERFLDEQGNLLPRTHQLLKNLLPFGVGRRQCVGEVFARSRIFLYITSLLQRWTIVPSRDRCGSCDPRSDQYDTMTVTMPKPFYCQFVQINGNDGNVSK